MPITAADKISAAQIQHYFEDATGKKDWSKRAWAEWCTMEKGLHPESMLIADSCLGLLTHAGFQILQRFFVQERVLAGNGWNHCQ